MADGATQNVLLVVQLPNASVDWKNLWAFGALLLIVCCFATFLRNGAIFDMFLKVEFQQGLMAKKLLSACWTLLTAFYHSFSLVGPFRQD